MLCQVLFNRLVKCFEFDKKAGPRARDADARIGLTNRGVCAIMNADGEKEFAVACVT